MKKSWSKYPKAKAGSKIENAAAKSLMTTQAYATVLRFDGGVSDNGSAHAWGQWGWTIDCGEVPSGSGRGEASTSPVTNNTCEWEGLIAGLKAASAMSQCRGLFIQGDSQLVICQLTGQWSANTPALKSLRAASWQLLADFGRPWSACWIPRSKNKTCDALTRRTRREVFQ